MLVAASHPGAPRGEHALQRRFRQAPSEPYDMPLWCRPKVARDQHAQVAKALYSLPTHFVGKTLTARADRSTVRFYERAVFVFQPESSEPSSASPATCYGEPTRCG
ncbi:MAG: hypothetical protein ACE5JI_19150 [Acidobacteriota bacterium]